MANGTNVVVQHVVPDAVRHARISGGKRALALAHKTKMSFSAADVVPHTFKRSTVVLAAQFEAAVVELLHVDGVLVAEFRKLAGVDLRGGVAPRTLAGEALGAEVVA